MDCRHIGPVTSLRLRSKTTEVYKASKIREAEDWQAKYGEYARKQTMPASFALAKGRRDRKKVGWIGFL